MNDITPLGRLPTPKVPQRPLNGVRPMVVPKRTSAAPTEPQSPRIPIEESGALDLPPALPPETVEFERPKRKWLKWVMITLAALILLAVATGVAAYFWYKDALQPLSSSQERIKVEVAPGAVADQVAATLEEKKVIKSALALQIYIKLHGKGDIKAGNYVFTPSQGSFEIVEWLTQGKVDTFKLTILPGKTLAELKKSFQDYGYSTNEIDEAFSESYNHPLLSDKPAGTSLEGYIYPETYSISVDTSLESVITQGFDIFQSRIEKENLKPTLAAKGLNLYQAITLASIIEQEVPHETDQKQVAQVFLLRMQQGMPLGSDVTYHYGAELLGVEPTASLDSPYNTRIHTGLPPGPIGNFNITALSAAANPSSGDYLFFVAGDDGTTHFSRTEAEHQRNIDQYCQKLCSTF